MSTIIRQNFSEGSLSTARLPGDKFQTTMLHRDYNGGKPIVVANADTEKDAREAHNEWAWMMVERKLPDEIYDENESPAALLADAKYGVEWRIHVRQRNYVSLSTPLPTRVDLRVPAIFCLALAVAILISWLITH